MIRVWCQGRLSDGGPYFMCVSLRAKAVLNTSHVPPAFQCLVPCYVLLSTGQAVATTDRDIVLPPYIPAGPPALRSERAPPRSPFLVIALGRSPWFYHKALKFPVGTHQKGTFSACLVKTHRTYQKSKLHQVAHRSVHNNFHNFGGKKMVTFNREPKLYIKQ